MTEVQRHEVWLAADDNQAALQILAHVSRPHRLEQSVELLKDWMARTGKPSRIEPKMATFQKDLMRAIEAAAWLQNAILAKGSERLPVMKSYKRSLRSMAAKGSDYEQHEEGIGNVIRDVWLKRKEQVHLALAAGNEIGRLHHDNGIKGLDWRLVTTNTTWVEPTLVQSERWAKSADALAIVPLGKLHHFLR